MLNAKRPPLPLHTACLHFYAALSEEAIARQMHDMSLAKIEAFQRTKKSFESAASTLPTPDKHDKDNGYLSADSGSDVDDTVSLDDSVSSVEGSHPCSMPSSPLSKQFEQHASPNAPLAPLPLKICKIAQEKKSAFNEKRAFFESRLQASQSSPSISPAPRSPALNKPLPTPPPSPVDSRSRRQSRPQSNLTPSGVVSGVPSIAQERYNEQLVEFAQMLVKHIEFAEEAITKTREVQASGRRRLIKERRTGTNQEDEKLCDLKARIAHLKKRGFFREQFLPTKYQELCERAVAEL